MRVNNCFGNYCNKSLCFVCFIVLGKICGDNKVRNKVVVVLGLNCYNILGCRGILDFGKYMI